MLELILFVYKNRQSQTDRKAQAVGTTATPYKPGGDKTFSAIFVYRAAPLVVQHSRLEFSQKTCVFAPKIDSAGLKVLGGTMKLVKADTEPYSAHKAISVENLPCYQVQIGSSD